MRCASIYIPVFAGLVFAAVSCESTKTNDWRPIYFTNQTAISNGQTVLSAVRSGSSQAQTETQALIGSPVTFVGGTAPPGSNADLLVWSNVVLQVSIKPPQDVRPHAVAWSAEVTGTLESVDFPKRIIRIRARPEDWMVRDTY